MDRLLTHVRSRSSIFFFPNRTLSSFKPNSFELKSRVLLNLINQSNAPKQNSSIPLIDFDTTNELTSIFPLPGQIGFGYETKPLLKLDLNRYKKTHEEKDPLEQFKISSLPTKNNEEFLSKLKNNKNLEIRTYGCTPSIRSEFHELFLNYNVSSQPLTAITILFKTKTDMSTWSTAVDNERNQLIGQFTKLAHELCTYLGTKQYWADFIDPSNGKPYYGPPTSDVLFETDERYQHFGINTIDLGCCRIIQHLQHGTHVFLGCIFTSAPKTDSNIQKLLKEFDISAC
ncbi:unnamed protein product [Adineta steineri]|uniref:Methylmalonic aciduria and homocystinuria type D-like protein n=1 Tax=Adineta steineri TaxID=433720 RepID=A0A818W880_9BILA|nr:unnamed protein product [Adineta steineri]